MFSFFSSSYLSVASHYVCDHCCIISGIHYQWINFQTIDSLSIFNKEKKTFFYQKKKPRCKLMIVTNFCSNWTKIEKKYNSIDWQVGRKGNRTRCFFVVVSSNWWNGSNWKSAEKSVFVEIWQFFFIHHRYLQFYQKITKFVHKSVTYTPFVSIKLRELSSTDRKMNKQQNMNILELTCFDRNTKDQLCLFSTISKRIKKKSHWQTYECNLGETKKKWFYQIN